MRAFRKNGSSYAEVCQVSGKKVDRKLGIDEQPRRTASPFLRDRAEMDPGLSASGSGRHAAQSCSEIFPSRFAAIQLKFGFISERTLSTIRSVVNSPTRSGLFFLRDKQRGLIRGAREGSRVMRHDADVRVYVYCGIMDIRIR